MKQEVRKHIASILEDFMEDTDWRRVKPDGEKEEPTFKEFLSWLDIT